MDVQLQQARAQLMTERNRNRVLEEQVEEARAESATLQWELDHRGTAVEALSEVGCCWGASDG